MLPSEYLFVLSNSDPGILILNHRIFFLLVVELKSRPCENSLADFCNSASLNALKINLV